MLSAKGTTYNELCLAELGSPPLRALVSAKQRKIFSAQWRAREGIADDLLTGSRNTHHTGCGLVWSRPPQRPERRRAGHNETNDIKHSNV